MLYSVGDRVEIVFGKGTIVSARNSYGTRKRYVVIYDVKLDHPGAVQFLHDFLEQENNGCWEVAESQITLLNKYKFILIAKPVIIEAADEDQAKIEFVRYLEEELKVIDYLGEV